MGSELITNIGLFLGYSILQDIAKIVSFTISFLFWKLKLRKNIVVDYFI
jgi:hypothetical protein